VEEGSFREPCELDRNTFQWRATRIAWKRAASLLDQPGTERLAMR